MTHLQRVRHFLLPIIMVLLLMPSAHAEECPHEYVQMREEPSCDITGVAWLECVLCGDTKEYTIIPALGHTFCEWYVVTEPDCTHEGLQARDCVVCYARETAPIPHLGHDYIVEVMPPTCTARGYTSYYCPGCGDRFRTDYTQSLGHRYDEGVIIREPTLDAMGRILYPCIGCGDTYQETIPKLTNPFVDIDKNAYYFASVIWAVNQGITTGIDETHFVPDEVCNRAQVVTFLWRSAGKPKPDTTVNPFRDVPKGSFYEEAVLWAFEKGITTGTDQTHFEPDAPCSRAQVVTFLHRFRGCPEPTVSTPFPDIKPSAFYYKAVLWAAQRQITVGMDGGKFFPDLSCSRAQIVTFLYRDEKNP